MTRVALLDYGVGNVFSVRRALERLGAEVVTTSDPGLVAAASRVVLPGVGAFGSMPSMIRLTNRGQASGSSTRTLRRSAEATGAGQTFGLR